ncbi:hypothetical protein, partial [Hominenteromicrobium sp.]|uniref:hypothetical protein n=1 Tax=Hominenteromicrobium sp. TaxID=3073581 RepID=UPI003AF1CD3D
INIHQIGILFNREIPESQNFSEKAGNKDTEREFSVQNGRKRRLFFENRRTEHKKSGEYGNRTSAVCPNSVQSETARGLTARGE